MLAMAGAGSPAGWRSVPIRLTVPASTNGYVFGGHRRTWGIEVEDPDYLEEATEYERMSSIIT